jgi:hypothetical protein
VTIPLAVLGEEGLEQPSLQQGPHFRGG